MKIIADENIPFAREAFSTLGDVTLVHGRKSTAAEVADAELLFVRSITKVNAALLEGAEALSGSRVKFVGTATAGFDHLDTDYLARRGVTFASAPGSNANSVAEYMTVAWLTLAKRKQFRLAGLKVGIIGVGQVGSRVEAKARALGMTPVLNDPPKERETGDAKYRPLDELFDCDILTLHTPLTRDGQDPTFHLANEEFFARMKKGAIFCSAGRGEVVDEAALRPRVEGGFLKATVLDVWENEPRISPATLALADLASPHVAGYSYDGKVNGTIMVYEAACEFLGVAPSWDARKSMRAPEFPELEIDATERDDEDVLLEATSRLYPIERDDATLRATLDMSPEARGVDFDRQRKEYPYRREFPNTRLTLRGASESLRRKAAGIGFVIG